MTTYWVFGEPDLDEALAAWVESAPTAQDAQSAAVEARLIKEFLASEGMWHTRRQVADPEV